MADIGDMRSAGSAELDASVDSSIQARAMALLFLAGATIGAISMVLPHSAAANDGALWSNVALATFGLRPRNFRAPAQP